ncbi:transglutaminase domain-containing protein [Lacticaseibacillus sp. GG6-2]
MQAKTHEWHALLTAWLLMVLCQAYLQVNPMPNVWFVALAVVVAVGTALLGRLLPRWRGLWFAIDVVGLAVIWPLVIAAKNRGNAWQSLLKALPQFGQTHGVDVPLILTSALLLMLIGLLAMIGVYWHQPIWAWVVVVAYVLLVHVVNGNELLIPVVQLLVLAAIFAFGSWQAVGLRIVVIAAVVGLAFVGLTQLTPPLAQATVGIRTWLNTHGVYDRISQIKAGPSRTGFSENDENLGGPVFDDNTAVYTVTSPTPQYLRVEAKTDYTGRGWTTSQPTREDFGGTVTDRELKDASDAAYQPTTKMTITAATTTRVLGLPNGAITVTATTPQARHMYYDGNTARLYPEVPLKQLELQVRAKKPSATALRSVTGVATDPAWTQVPKTLPVRVRQLAQRVTRGATTDYDRAKAIEQYLSQTPTLTYSKTDTPKLPRGRDYVDYFLFTSHIGYCDNFSSAMVMMLRSIGVPARWAKGFNQGTKTGTDQYTITNANAHSWPEVYFGPQYGWVDFEPTPGFAASTSTNTPVASSSQSSAASQSSSSSSSSSASSKSAVTKTTTKPQHVSGDYRWVLVVVGLVLVVALTITRRRLVALLTLIGLNATNFPKRYRLLLWSLRGVVKRQSSQPLSAYAREVDAKLGLPGSFAEVTAAYEASEFGGRGQLPKDAFVRVVQAVAWHRKR